MHKGFHKLFKNLGQKSLIHHTNLTYLPNCFEVKNVTQFQYNISKSLNWQLSKVQKCFLSSEFNCSKSTCNALLFFWLTFPYQCTDLTLEKG